MVNTYCRRKKERGQTLIIVAFSIIVLIAFVGLGVDLGLTYVEKVRVQRAADAAALAGAAELPVEAAARLRALEYLAENNYDCGLVVAGNDVQCTDPNVHVTVDGNENFSDPPSDIPTKIVISTLENQTDNKGTPIANTSSRIRVEVTQQVTMFFMRLLGFNTVPVYGVASAENIVKLDVVLVFDKSGSMQFDTLCYGCWVPQNGEEYPDGRYAPLRWDGAPYGPPLHCNGAANGDERIETVNKDYSAMLIEAEEYSWKNNPIERKAGYTYWVMQHNGKITDPQSGYLGDAGDKLSRDVQGAYVTHMPFRIGVDRNDGSSGVPCLWEDIVNGFCNDDSWVTERLGSPASPPRMTYEFRIPEDAEGGDTWYFWINAQGGDPGEEGGQDPTYRGQGIYWGLSGGGYGAYTTPTGHGEINRASGDWSWKYDGAVPKYWTWRRLRGGAGPTGGSSGFTLEREVTYTLHLVAGSSGFSVDKIVITNYSSDKVSTIFNGLSPNNYRSGWACDPCDARFGGNPDGMGNLADESAGESPLPRCDAVSGAGLPEASRNRFTDIIYDDEQPFATTAASALRFMRKLDYQFDQIGLVRYSTKSDSAIDLLCKSASEQGKVTGGCTKNVIEQTIYSELIDRNKTFADGATNLADGLDDAIQMMDNTPPHYGRPEAAHIIILMTDGQPNCPERGDSSECGNFSNFQDKDDRTCDSYGDLWPYSSSDAYDCAMYFATKARNRGIIIYGITLGEGADQDLIAAIAELTGGEHLHAQKPEQLDAIFDYLFNRIFLRLVE